MRRRSNFAVWQSTRAKPSQTPQSTGSQSTALRRSAIRSDIPESVSIKMNLNNVKDIYPLSPIQQGILFHTLYSPEAGEYIMQMVCTLQGDVDASAFDLAWQRVVD